ncbi:hypothetical protein [Nocardiopsis sp. YSL2]|uniref:hypothetical protein n=1 Tax=Nocardiopsis sp. YSL2 TaxID=2939492 RepID=UPI0026F42909|nr:hypothetical protein [Nocardiopsis sp. YSL2]
MVNKRLKARAVLALARRHARKQGLRIEEMKGRGKGSHQVYVILDADGERVGRFLLTNHSRDLTQGVLQDVESGLAHLFGEKWMEK